MDLSSELRLVISLSVAGSLLLGWHVFNPSIIFKLFGFGSFVGALGIAFTKCGIDVGTILLLILAHVVGLGWLLVLIYFPKSELAKRTLEAASRLKSDEDHIK